MGYLGKLMWFRCRNCGIEFSAPDWVEEANAVIDEEGDDAV
jgi:hypothetical protein